MTMLQGKQLTTVQNQETESNSEQELTEKPPAVPPCKQTLATTATSVHPGMLPTITTITPSTSHHVPMPPWAILPGQPVIELSSYKDDNGSSNDCESTIESVYNKSRSTQDCILPPHQDISNVRI